LKKQPKPDHNASTRGRSLRERTNSESSPCGLSCAAFRRASSNWRGNARPQECAFGRSRGNSVGRAGASRGKCHLCRSGGRCVPCPWFPAVFRRLYRAER